jgi:hypothetical protein
VNLEIYKEYFHAMKPKCTMEATKDRHEDFNKSKSRLCKGKYKVGSMKIECLIKSYTASQKDDLLRSIDLMRTWSHPNLVRMENLYREKTSQRLVILNDMDGSLEKYIKSSVQKNEDVISNADGTFTIFFKRMIL